MSQIRAILFRLRAAIVLVAVAAVFGGVVLSAPSARASAAAIGVSAPCDHLAGAASASRGAPVKQTGHASHCPECCLFGGGVGDLALTPRTSFFAKPSVETGARTFYAVSRASAPEFLLTGAANGARAPPIAA